MSKPDARMYETFALMARGRPLHKIEALCEKQKTVACSVLARMVEEAQDINTDYALTIRYSHEAARAADKARIAELEGLLRVIAVGISKREMPTEGTLNIWFDCIESTLAKHGEQP